MHGVQLFDELAKTAHTTLLLWPSERDEFRAVVRLVRVGEALSEVALEGEDAGNEIGDLESAA